MEIAIGLLAHNEEKRIENTLRSIFLQSIFGRECRDQLGITRIQVACVPNGCTDRTGEQIRSFSDRLVRDEAISFECHELAEPGKSAAWNTFVHLLSARDARYLVLLDADIEFGSSDVLEQMLLYMEAHPKVVVGTDRPVKRIGKKSDLSIQEKLSLAASNQVETDGKLSGQLYFGRADELRRIWMPLALPVEDGFLAAMVSTEGFTRKGRAGCIAQVPKVFHYYDAHETAGQFFRHESRIVVGSTINAWLFGLLWEKGKSGHAGEFVKQANEHDPNWLEELVKVRASREKWLVPNGFALKRLRNLKGKALSVKLAMLPIALGSTLIQILVCIRANSLLRREGSTRFW